MINNGVHVAPRFEFTLPVHNGRQRCNDQVWSSDAAFLYFDQERDGLNGLAQTHFVGQDAVLSENERLQTLTTLL